MTDRTPMFAIEARQIIAGKPQRLWYRACDNHWTHHSTRVQFYDHGTAMDIFDALPIVSERVVRVIPADEVPS